MDFKKIPFLGLRIDLPRVLPSLSFFFFLKKEKNILFMENQPITRRRPPFNSTTVIISITFPLFFRFFFFSSHLNFNSDKKVEICPLCSKYSGEHL
jgi:hypothetical protein